jgi:hypothetical protein
VRIVNDPTKLDTVCVYTINGRVTYQRQYTDIGDGGLNTGNSFIKDIPAAEAVNLLDKKRAWVTYVACYSNAAAQPRKERKQARLDCASAFRTAQPELAAIMIHGR